MQGKIADGGNMQPLRFLVRRRARRSELVERPSDCLRAVAVVEIEVEDDGVAQPVLFRCVRDRDVYVVEPAES